MVDEALGRDLLSFGTKVLVIGDPFQLPPVQGAGFFTAHDPDIMLTEIHRQARDNPIIRMSMDIREGEYLEHGRYGESLVIPRTEVDRDAVMLADQVADVVRVSADLPQHAAWIQEYVDQGWEEVYLHFVGQEQERFLDAFGTHVLPQLDPQRPAAATTARPAVEREEVTR